MAFTLIYASTTDGGIQYNHVSSYANARQGTGGTGSLEGNSQNYWSWGQRFAGGQYFVWEGFTEFPYSPPSGAGNDYAVSAFLQFTLMQMTGTAARSLDTHGYNWGGGALTASDFLPGASIAGATYYGAILNAQSWAAGTRAKCSSDAMRALGATAGTFRFVHSSSRTKNGNAPTGDEYAKTHSADASGTTNDPLLLIGTIRRNTLTYTHATAAQLSTGETVFVESDGAAVPALTLKYRAPGGAATTIGALTTTGGGFDVQVPSQQKIALVVDSSDNIYVIGRRDEGSSLDNNIVAKCYKKGSGLTWTGMGAVFGTMPAYSAGGGLNQGVGTWHATGGAGHIMYVGGHIAWTGRNGTMFYAVLDCSTMIAGTGTLVASSGADPTWLISASVGDYVDYPNETGSHLDVMTDPDVPTRGYVVCTDVDDYLNLGTYTLSAAGVVTASTQSSHGTTMYAPHDPQGKARVIVLPGDRQVWSNGSHIRARSSDGSTLGEAFLDSVGLTNFPTQAALNASGAWDMVFDPAASKVWVYYLDTVDSRILRRTGFSTQTYGATGDSVIVSSAVGAVGSTNLGIRVPRGKVDERKTQLAVANLNGSALSTVYLDDSLNQAPSAPLLGVIAPFDALQPKVFYWNFQDKNPSDTQTAYQLQIIRTSDSVSMLDTGKVTSTAQQHTVPSGTLANSVAYQWRVRTWDPADATGTWSTFQDFTTSGGGNVTVTDPPTDNPGNQYTSDYTISWSVSGTVQASYRVQAIRTSDGATFYDSGYITSTATSALVQNLQTGVEYRIQVTVRNAALAVSNPGTRLITPNYSAPEVPELSLAWGDTWVEASVTNPTPTGDRPEVSLNRLYRRRVGSVAWEYLADLPYNGTFRDYTAAAGIPYEYKVIGEG